MRKIYFHNHNITVSYDEQLHLGVAVWRGELSGADFREAVLICLDVIDRFELKIWLGDNRKLKPISADDAEWAHKVFVPQLIEGSLLRMANLPSEQEASKQVIDTMVQKSNGIKHIEVRDFTDETEALAWLLELTEEKS